MIDDALKHETESLRRGEPTEARSEEFREQEGPADGEPTPDARIHGRVGRRPPARTLGSGAPGQHLGHRGGAEIPGTGLSLDDLNGRTELARYLEHRKFPARPDELAAHAEARHAPDTVVAQLRQAPDRMYETVSEVWAALGGRVERPRDQRN